MPTTTTYDDQNSRYCISEIVNKSSPTISEICFRNLSASADYKCLYIQGEVCTKCPIQRSKYRTQMKVVIQQDGSDETLPVFFFGKVAEECQHVTPGDVIALCGICVEDNVRRLPNVCPWQLTVDADRTLPRVWILRRSMNTQPAPSVDNEPTVPPERNVSTIQSPARGASNMASPSSKSLTVYTALNCLVPDERFNVFGVVRYVRSAQPTRRGEFSFMVTIVDDSDTTGMNCMFFRQRVSEFPDVQLGDVIRLHRVKVETYNMKLTCVVTVRGVAYLVFDGAVGASLTPRSDNQHYSLTPQDIDRVCELRTFFAANEHQLVQDKGSPQPFTCCDVKLASCKPGYKFNLLCQVVGICVIRPNELVFLQVWDGSHITFPLREEDLSKEGDALNRLVVDDELQQWAGEMAVNLRIWDNHTVSLYNVKCGDIVKVKGLVVGKAWLKNGDRHCAGQAYELNLYRGTEKGKGITLLPADHPEAITLQRNLASLSDTQEPSSSTQGAHQSNIASSLNAVQMSPVGEQTAHILADVGSPERDARHQTDTVTVLTAHHDRPVSKFQDVFKHSVPYKFRVQCHIREYLPKLKKPHDLIKLYCKRCNYIADVPSDKNAPETSDDPICLKTNHKLQRYSCPRCCSAPSGNVLDYIMMLQFMLEDPTGWLVAGLWKSDAEDFFNGTTAGEIMLDNDTFEYVQSQLERVCGKDCVEDMDDPAGMQESCPLADCCLKSYTTASGTHYQIFSTCVAWSNLDISLL